MTSDEPSETIQVRPEEAAAVRVLNAIWTRIDWDKVDAGRSVADEFTSRVQVAANEPNLARFAQTLARKMGVRGLSHDDQLLQAFHDADDQAVLDLLRNETMYLVLVMRDTRPIEVVQ